MSYQRSLIAAGALSLAVLVPAGGAMAADMPSYTPPPPMAVAPVWSWQGFYVGLFAGAAWGDVDATELFNVPTLTYYNGFGANYTLDGTGFFGGAQAGYNWQIDQFVLGVEGELGYMNLKDSVLDPNSLLLPVPDTETKFDSDFYGALTGRVGFAVDQVLLYAKGGVAFLNADATTLDACNVGGCGALLINATGSDTMVGWTLGGGLEYAFTPNWSIKAEYMYFDFGDFDISGLASNGLVYTQNFDVTAHTAKVGINYRF